MIIDIIFPVPKDEHEGAIIGAIEEFIRRLPDPTPVGAVGIFYIVPGGWLQANGTAFDTDANPELALVIGSGNLPTFVSPFAGTVVAIKT